MLGHELVKAVRTHVGTRELLALFALLGLLLGLLGLPVAAHERAVGDLVGDLGDPVLLHRRHELAGGELGGVGAHLVPARREQIEDEQQAQDEVDQARAAPLGSGRCGVALHVIVVVGHRGS